MALRSCANFVKVRRLEWPLRQSVGFPTVRAEPIAIHSGFDADPTTHAVAVPIYQTAAYQFDSADHGAALFNLEEDGYRYSRISNPTNAILEERVAQLEGGAAGVALASG